MSFGSSKTKTSSKSQSDPWDVTIPALTDYLDLATSQGGIGITPDQEVAFSALKNNAASGNPYAQQIDALAQSRFQGTPDRTGVASDALTGLQDQLGDYASGKFVDPMSDPNFMKYLTQIGDDAANRTNAQFAAAGRDMSGANQAAVGRAVTQAQLPTIVNQYNQNRQQQIDAAKTLYDAGTGTATTLSSLDAARQASQNGAVDLSKEAIDAENYGANALLNLDQQIKGMPYEDLALLGSLLLPVAGLGGQSSGSGTGKTSGFGISLSDERAKEDVEQVGQMADGTPIYRWRYKGDPELRIGPMAQEVEEDNPGAVHDDPATGLKYVDMDAATRRAADIVKSRMAKRKG